MATNADTIPLDTSAAIALVRPEQSGLTASAAARLIATNFPHECHLSPRTAADLIESFAAAGISGGAVYDGLVASAAVAAELPLISVDRRAEPIYRSLGVQLRML